MNLSTSTLAAGLLAAFLGAAAIGPAAAQDAPVQARPDTPPHQQMFHHHGGDRFRIMGRHRGAETGERGHGGLPMLACSERGADRLEHMLLSLSQRLDPTAEQQPLFDELKSVALSAQAEFAEACAAARPATGDTAERPDLLERLQTGVAVGEARIAAMREVLPAFEAFHESLTDEQKALLEPHRGMRERHRGGRR